MPTIKLRLPSNRTLGNICVYGAVVSISAVMYMKWKLEDRVRNTEYYKLALQTMRKHRGAIKLLGEPIKESGFDMSNVTNTCNAEKAQFEVKVNGSKDKGVLFFWAHNEGDNKGWQIDRLELEAKQHPNKRFLLRKQEEYTIPHDHNDQIQATLTSPTTQSQPNAPSLGGTENTLEAPTTPTTPTTSNNDTG